MPSPVAAALALQASAAADAITAEGWTLVPMRKAAERDAGTVPDPSRLSLPIRATFTDREAKADVNMYDPREKRRPGVIAGKAGALVSVAAMAAAKALAAARGGTFAVQQFDKLVRDADGATWVIASAFPLPVGTLRLGLDLLGRDPS